MTDRIYFISCNAVSPDETDLVSKTWSLSKELWERMTKMISEELGDDCGMSVLVEDINSTDPTNYLIL